MLLSCFGLLMLPNFRGFNDTNVIVKIDNQIKRVVILLKACFVKT